MKTMNDTVNEQPVETLEESISKVLDSAEDEPEQLEEEIESKKEDQEDEPLGNNEDSDEQPATEEADGEDGAGDQGNLEEDEDAPADEDIEPVSEGEESLTAPEHWSAADRETFEEIPRQAQEFILKRHKEMEGDYTRKSQEIADTKRQYDAVRDALAPYEQEFASAGLDHAGAVRKLASVHQGLKTDGKATILALAQTYGIDLSEEDPDMDPATRQVQSQLTATEQRLARIEQEAQQTNQQAILDAIQKFENEKDTSGKLAHPHFRELQDDITRLLTGGIASGLEDGYRKALALRPDLIPKKEIPKVSRAEKVKQAKKAATGIKSSGAVGKPERALTLEEEIASLIP